MLVGAAHPGATVGGVEADHRAVRACALLSQLRCGIEGKREATVGGVEFVYKIGIVFRLGG